MWRRSRRLLAAVTVAIALLLFGLPDRSAASAHAVAAQDGAQDGAPFCEDGQAPRFAHALAGLRERLGDRLGEPVECEHVDPWSGDAVQRTTTGLAYYRPSIGMAIFTDGESHWGLADEGGPPIRWRTGSVTPPEPSAAEAGYLALVAPLRERAAALQRRLLAAYQQAERGQLNNADVAVLRALVNDLEAARDAYAGLRDAGRLGRHHGLMVQALNTGMGAAEMLTQARQLPAGAVRASFQARAAAYVQEAERLRQAAGEAYAQVLPVAAE